MNDNSILVIIVVVAAIMILSLVHRGHIKRKKRRREYPGIDKKETEEGTLQTWKTWKNIEPMTEQKHFHHHPPYHPCECRVPVAVRLEIREYSVNNNNITIKGKNMSVALLGKQTVDGTLVPLDSNNQPIVQDPNLPPVDVIQPGSISASSSDLDLFSVSVDPSNQLKLVAVSTGTKAGIGTISFIGRNVNGDLISGSDDITVTLPEETTSTSTSTTTTEGGPAVPLAVGFQLNWGTPTDI